MIVDKANLVPGLLRSIGIGTAAGVMVGPLLGVVLPAYFTSIAGCVFGLTFGGITFAIAHIFYQRQALTTFAYAISLGLALAHLLLDPICWLRSQFLHDPRRFDSDVLLIHFRSHFIDVVCQTRCPG